MDLSDLVDDIINSVEKDSVCPKHATIQSMTTLIDEDHIAPIDTIHLIYLKKKIKDNSAAYRQFNELCPLLDKIVEYKTNILRR